MARRNDSSAGSFTRYFKFAGFVLLGLLILTLLAPTLIAKTGLSTWFLNRATAGLPISVNVGSLSLGWFTTTSATDVVVKDDQGNLLAQIPNVEIDRNLWSLLLDRDDLGTIKLERPSMDIVVTNDSSNVERLIAAWPKAPTPPPTAPPPSAGQRGKTRFKVELVDGAVRLVDDAKNQSWQLEKIKATLGQDAAVNPPIKGSLSAQVQGEKDSKIDFSLDGNFRDAVNGKAEGTFINIPLAMFGPIARRGGGDLTCTGPLRGFFKAIWLLTPNNSPVVEIGGGVLGENLVFSGGPFGADRFALNQLHLKGFRAEYNATQLQYELKDLMCDVGHLNAEGKYLFAAPFLVNMSEPGTVIEAEVNLAKLSQLMPKTLRVHDDVRVTSGKARLTGKSEIASGITVWNGKLTTTEIQGERNGTALSWPEPLLVEFHLKQRPGSWPDIDALVCKSRFLSLSASATAAQLRLGAQADLGQLAKSLGQFVDVGSFGLAGSADAGLAIAQPDPKTQIIDAQVKLIQFQWGQWREDNLLLNANAVVQTDNDRRKIDKSAVLRITSGQDVLDIGLREPIAITDQIQSGAFFVKLDGNLANWQHRFKLFAPALADLGLKGIAKGEASVTFAPRKVEVQSLHLAAHDFGMTLGGSPIRDPNVELQAELTYSGDTSSLEMRNAKIQSGAFVMNTGKFNVDLSKGTMAGSIVYKGDLGKMQAWYGPVPPGGDFWTGTMFGEADLKSDTAGCDIDMKTNLREVHFGPPKAPRFSEPAAVLSAKGRLDSKQGTLKFDKVQFTSQLGVIDANLNLDKLDTFANLDVAGSLAYDLATIEPLVKSYLGAGAKIQGKDRRDFHFAGPLRPKGAGPKSVMELTGLIGNAGLSWQHFYGYGADVGPADLKANLRGGWLKFDPIVASLNQGSLKLAPNIRIDPLPAELVLPAGPVIENAKITPAMTSSGLGYTLPLIANATSIEGELSLSLAGATIPFGDVTKSYAEGSLKLHHAKLGPGPMITELLGVLKAASPHSFIKDNEVKFKVDKGRVYHNGLEVLVSDGLKVRSYGSVGFDGTLDMIAEVPLPQKLLGTIKLPAGVAGTPVKLPITGTIQHPRIDPRALQDAISQAGRDAAKGAAGDLLKKGLDKLLKPRN